MAEPIITGTQARFLANVLRQVARRGGARAGKFLFKTHAGHVALGTAAGFGAGVHTMHKIQQFGTRLLFPGAQGPPKKVKKPKGGA